jgi:phosphopantothenoylcysteine decarboxylase/phosphopantothenate--cysteine ligase
MARIVLGVTGGIAAYKACELLRRLSEAGHEVTVVPTRAALEFVGEATWAALSGRPVAVDVFSAVHQVLHVRLGQEADLVIVAPATADALARAAQGLAPDLLGNVLLTARCPVVFAPAMHSEMWSNPATVANVAVLRQRGALVVEPASGRLTGADSGPGRMPEPAELFTLTEAVLAGGVPDRDLTGRRVLITAGGTREFLDPVRFLGNRSSGLQGYALAAAAGVRGAQVTLISANPSLPPPAGVTVIPVVSAEDMLREVSVAGEFDAVVMAAAVADYRPALVVDAKLKKESGPLTDIPLVENPDILAGLVAARGSADSPVIVGFAAETGDEDGDYLSYGRRKLARKGCDLLVVNQVGHGVAFEVDRNAAVILTAGGQEVDVPLVSKRRLADAVWDAVIASGALK